MLRHYFSTQHQALTPAQSAITTRLLNIQVYWEIPMLPTAGMTFARLFDLLFLKISQPCTSTLSI